MVNIRSFDAFFKLVDRDICSEGTFIAFDCETPQMRDGFIKEMRLKGINLGGCGDRGESRHCYMNCT